MKLVRQLQGLGGQVLVVGDGVNDAAALAAAHLGVEGSTIIVGLNGLRLLGPSAWRVTGARPSRRRQEPPVRPPTTDPNQAPEAVR